jgi:hypothetical protein
VTGSKGKKVKQETSTVPAFHVVAQGPMPVPTGQSKINSIFVTCVGVLVRCAQRTRLAMGMVQQRPGRHASCVMCDEVPGRKKPLQ